MRLYRPVWRAPSRGYNLCRRCCVKPSKWSDEPSRALQLSAHAGPPPDVVTLATRQRRDRKIQSSNCVESQAEWLATAEGVSSQVEPYLSMELRMTSSLRMHATRATFFGLPAASSL